jgi:L-ascorbate metabolism protein UlaG (beta-lactamase superfamily)
VARWSRGGPLGRGVGRGVVVRLTWLRHSTVVLEVDGVRIVTDPLLRDRVGMLRAVPVPATADLRPWTGRGFDAVLLTHLHHDHCDLPSLRALGAPAVVAPVGAGAWLRRRGVGNVEELPVGDTRTVAGDVVVTAVPARHHGRREPWGPHATSVGHLVTCRDLTVWVAGDTDLHPGMAGIAAMGPRGVVDVAVVPVWGWGPRLGKGHLDPVRAAAAVRLVGARAAVPVHWGTLHVLGMSGVMGRRLTMPGSEFVRALGAPGRESGAVHGLLLGPGQPIELR